MCLAFPGKIISIKNQQKAVIDFNGIKKDINVSLVKVKKGDYVIVHAGFAIQKLEKKEAIDIFQLYEKLRNEKSNPGNK